MDTPIATPRQKETPGMAAPRSTVIEITLHVIAVTPRDDGYDEVTFYSEGYEKTFAAPTGTYRVYSARQARWDYLHSKLYPPPGCIELETLKSRRRKSA